MERRNLLPLLTAVPLVPAASVRAQLSSAGAAWRPDRPIRFEVGFAPGGSTDTTARVVAQGITAGLGQPVVVENRTGAAGNVATEHVARSAPGLALARAISSATLRTGSDGWTTRRHALSATSETGAKSRTTSKGRSR